MTTKTIFETANNTAEMSFIEDLVRQLPPSMKTIISDKIDVSNFPTSYEVSGRFDTAYSNSGTNFIYVPEYNDLMVNSKYQYATTPQGNNVLIFHDFINPQTQQPHINPANATLSSIDLITGINHVSVSQQQCFWQHGYFWQIFGVHQSSAYTANSQIPGKLIRYSYDGVKLTKVQTIDIPYVGRSTDSVIDPVFNFEVMANGMISSSVYNTMTIQLHKISENVVNDVWTVNTGTLVISNMFPSTEYSFAIRLNCFYFAQLKKWVYYTHGNSNRVETSFNTNADESSWSNLITSLNASANWHQSATGMLPLNHTRGCLCINGKDNKSVVAVIPQSTVYMNIPIATESEQLNMTTPWNILTTGAVNSTISLATDKRMYFVNFLTLKKIVPTSSTPINNDGVYNNDFADVSTAEMNLTWGQNSKINVAWTDDGETFFSKVVDVGASFYVGSQFAVDRVDNIYNHCFILNRYYLCWVDDETNIRSDGNKYGKIAIIDFSTAL